MAEQKPLTVTTAIINVRERSTMSAFLTALMSSVHMAGDATVEPAQYKVLLMLERQEAGEGQANG